MHLRKLLFWAHLVAGLAVGVVVFVMAVSGTLLSYERQIVRWADRDAAAQNPASSDPAEQRSIADPAGSAQRLSPEPLLAALHRSLPSGASITRLTLQAEPDAPALVSLRDGSTLLVSQTTGAVLKRSAARSVFHALEDVHRALALGLLHYRSAGTTVTGACNAAFFFLVLSGIYLWWPRKWTRRALRAVVWFEAGKRGKARDFNWHNVIGLWCALPLSVIVLSGLFISYPGLAQLVEKGSPLARPGAAPAQPPARAARDGAPTLDSLFADAAQRVPGWRAITIRFPAPEGSALTFAILKGEGVRPTHWSRLTVDRKTGAPLRWQQYGELGAARRAIAWGRWLHTGEAGGILGQTAAALASAGAALLVWTGFSLAWRRLFRRARSAP